MLSEIDIRNNLTEIEQLFNLSTGTLHSQLYAKLAIIEASTWIEIFIDDIFEDLYTSRLSNAENIRSYKKVIKDTYGFDYEKYIRNRLMRDLYGWVKIEKIETKLSGNGDYIQMTSSIKSLTDARNSCAHKPILGTTPTLIAPSLTISYFNEILLGIKVLEKELKKIR